MSERLNKVEIERDKITSSVKPDIDDPKIAERISDAAGEIRHARKHAKPVIMSFGAHAIKNGLAPVIIELLKKGMITHLATNGAGIIHDWEFAFQGASSEDVRENIASGQFGIWEETGFYINLALCAGAYEGLGYGESIGALIVNQGVLIPNPDELQSSVSAAITAGKYDRAASGLDFTEKIERYRLKTGFLSVAHPFRHYSVQAVAFEENVPFTGHPMFGHDIIYTHPMSSGAAIGRTAERDFLTFAGGVSKLAGGVYLSIGSAVMSPMIFEKSLSMAQNIALQENNRIEDFSIYVVDLAKSTWNWQKGEPPATDPAYYLRYLKTFSRMGGNMHYISIDNRDFLVSLFQKLC